jgi:hypothetical protein
MSTTPAYAQLLLAALTESQLIQFLVRFAYQLTIGGRGTYVPGGDDLDELDVVNEFAQRMTERSRDRRPPWLQAGMDRVKVASIILNNYLKTVFLALLGLLAIGLVILDMR